MASGEVSNMKVVENDSGQSESIRRTVCGLRTVRRSTIVYRRTSDDRQKTTALDYVSTSSVAVGEVWKPPEVAESDSVSDTRQDKLNFAAPRASFHPDDVSALE